MTDPTTVSGDDREGHAPDRPASEGELAAQYQAGETAEGEHAEAEPVNDSRTEPPGAPDEEPPLEFPDEPNSEPPAEPTGPGLEDAAPAEADEDEAAPTAAAEQGWVQ